MCRNCGAIVGAGEASCAVCNEPITDTSRLQASRPTPDRETLRFAHAILNRPYKFTILLLVANLFVFFLMWEASSKFNGTLWMFPQEVLVAFGAKLNRLIDEQNQWWRFVTPMFVHVGLIHLLVNMYGLWIIGPYVERLYGSARFVVIWVLSGTAGVVGSYLTVVPPETSFGWIGRFLFKGMDAPSAGASGALFGLVGVLFVFGIKYRRELPEGFKRAFGIGLMPIIVLNLFIGYVGRGLIDNAAHLGGLLMGGLLALFIGYRRPGQRPSVAITWRVMQVVALGVVAVSFVKVAQHLNDPQPPYLRVQASRNYWKPNDFVQFSIAINAGQEVLYSALHEKDISDVDAAIQRLEEAPNLDQEAVELREALLFLLSEAKKLPAEGGGEKHHDEQRQNLVAEFDTWKRNYNRWLRKIGTT